MLCETWVHGWNPKVWLCMMHKNLFLKDTIQRRCNFSHRRFAKFFQFPQTYGFANFISHSYRFNFFLLNALNGAMLSKILLHNWLVFFRIFFFPQAKHHFIVIFLLESFIRRSLNHLCWGTVRTMIKCGGDYIFRDCKTSESKTFSH